MDQEVGDAYGEEQKSPDNKKATQVKADNVSNISTQRASQVVNRFTSQISKTTEEIKEDISQIPNSPIFADPLLQNEIIDVAPGGVDLSATQPGNMISLATPATQAMHKAKSHNLRGKQTERVLDKTNQNATIQAEVIPFDEVNEANTQRVLKEEEVKNGRIHEEQESDNEKGTEHRSA